MLNVDGLGWEDKVRDICNYILLNDFHIAILLETRTSSTDKVFETFLPNYSVSQYDSRSTSKGHGIAVLVRDDIQHLVSLDSSSDFIQALWLRCSGTLFNLEGSVILGAVYINPETLGRNRGAIESCFEALQDETLTALCRSEHVMLMGDLNAHIGDQTEFVDEHFDLQDEFPCLQGRRQNASNFYQVNHAGKLLLELAAAGPLILTTGRGRGDAGQATYVGYRKNRSTHPDHALMTKHVFRKIHSCSIQAPEDCISDHCAMGISFVRHEYDWQNLGTGARNVQVCHHECKRRVYTWRPEKVVDYVNVLRNNVGARELFECALREKNVPQAYNILCGMIHDAANSAGMGRTVVCQACKQKQMFKAGIPKAPWFDEACDRAKKGYMHAFRERRATRELKHACKNVMRKAKRAYYNRQGDHFLELLSRKDPAIYDMLQKRKASENTTPIPADVWSNYLRQHFSFQDDHFTGGSTSKRGLGREGAVPIGRSRSNQSQGGRGSRYYDIPDYHTYFELVLKYINKMNGSSSPGFQKFSAAFLKYAVIVDGDTKINILAPLVAQLMHLILVTKQIPADWKTAKLTPIYKKGPKIEPGNYRMIAVSSTLYRLFANTLKDLLMAWCSDTHAIPDSQFGFYPGRSTLQPMFILRHLVHAAQRLKPHKSPHMHTAFVDFSQAYDTVPRPQLWDHLNRIGVPKFIIEILKEIYRGDEYVLVDGDKCARTLGVSLRGVKQGCPLSPLLFSLYLSDIDDAFRAYTGAVTGTETLRVTHLLFADDLALTANHTGHLQQMLDSLHRYSMRKGLVVNTLKTQVVHFNTCPTSKVDDVSFNGSRLEPQDCFKYLGMLFDKRMNLTNALTHASRPFAAAIHRIKEFASDKGLADWPHAMLWLFKAYAISAGMYASQVWCTPFLRADKVFDNKLQVKHLTFLKRVLRVKNSAPNWAVLRECAQEPLQFYWFRAAGRFWNSMVHSNSNTLRSVLKADICLGNDGCDRCWFRQFRDAMADLRSVSEFWACLSSFKKLNLYKLASDVRYRHHAVWREVQGQDPRVYRKKSAVYHTWFGLPLRDYSESRPSAHMPSYLSLNLNRKVIRDVSRFRLRAHGLKCEKGLYGSDRNELICDLCESGEVQDELHVVFRCSCPFLAQLRRDYAYLFAGVSQDLRAFANQSNFDVYKFLSALTRYFD